MSDFRRILRLQTRVEALEEGGGSNVSGIQYARVDVSSAEILALDTVAKELLPALSGRQYYILHHVITHYRFVTTPYNETSDIMVITFGSEVVSTPDYTQPSGAVYIWPAYDGVSKQLLQQTADAYTDKIIDKDIDNLIWLASVVEGQPLSLSSNAPFTGGDGTLTFRLFYSVLDGAP